MSLIEGIDLNSVANAELLASLLKLGPALDEIITANEKIASDAADVQRAFGLIPSAFEDAIAQMGLAVSDLPNTLGGMQEFITGLTEADQAALRPFISNLESFITVADEASEALDSTTRDLSGLTRSLEDEIALLQAADPEMERINMRIRDLTEQAGDDAGVLSLIDSLQELEVGALNSARATAITNERLGLERQLLQLQGDSAAIRNLERAALDESNRALFDRINALQDAQAAEVEAARREQEAAQAAEQAAQQATQRAQAIASERSGLERQLLQLQGDSAAIRNLERAALDESNRALFDRINALQDAQAAEVEAAASARAIADERLGLERQLLQLQGDSAALREIERNAISSGNQALFDRINALQDAQAAEAASAAAMQRIGSLQIELLRAQGRDAEAQARQDADRIAGAATETEAALISQIIAEQALARQREAFARAAEAAQQASQAAQAERQRLAEQEAQRIKAIADERLGLERQLLQLQGDSAALLALEREGIDKSNRALFDRIQALSSEQEAAEKLAASARAIADERLGLERRLLQAQGDTAAIRELELQALDESNRSILEQIFALEDLEAANQAATQAENDRAAAISTAESDLRTAYEREVAALDEIINSRSVAVDALRSAYDAEAAIFEGSIEQFKQFGAAIGEFAGRVRAAQGEAGVVSDVQVRGQFQDAARRARLGDATALESLPGLGDAFIESLRNTAGSREELLTGLAFASREAAAAQAVAGRQQTIAEQQLDALKNQVGGIIELQAEVQSVADAIAALTTADQQIASAQQSRDLLTEQVSALIQINESVLSVSDAIAALQGFDLVSATPESSVTATAAPAPIVISSGGSTPAPTGNGDVVAELRALRADVAQIAGDSSRNRQMIDRIDITLQRVMAPERDAIATREAA